MNKEELLKTNLITKLGLEELPDQKKMALINKFGELVEKRTILRLMEELKKEDAQEFEKVKEKSQEDKMKFLRERVPNLDEIVEEEIVKVKKEIIDENSKIEE
ncbi:MAG TPA: DUF5663 domain-containing protein [Patescibacteria group bacterium]|nr:DUF5663 domain-containing protein [Patescibacteria group bacterium]